MDLFYLSECEDRSLSSDKLSDSGFSCDEVPANSGYFFPVDSLVPNRTVCMSETQPLGWFSLSSNVDADSDLTMMLQSAKKRSFDDLSLAPKKPKDTTRNNATKRKATKVPAVPLSNHAVYINRTSWSHKEEVFLVGAVLERFFTVGSLSSKPGKQKKDGGVGQNECWEDIKHIYDRAWDNHACIAAIEPPYERSSGALARHYKVMKAILNKDDNIGKTFRQYWNEFHEEYNQGEQIVKSTRTVE